MNGHKVLPQFLGVAHCTGTLNLGQDQKTGAFISFRPRLSEICYHRPPIYD